MLDTVAQILILNFFVGRLAIVVVAMKHRHSLSIGGQNCIARVRPVPLFSSYYYYYYYSFCMLQHLISDYIVVYHARART